MNRLKKLQHISRHAGLDTLTRDELDVRARALKIRVTSRWTDARVIERIKGAS